MKYKTIISSCKDIINIALGVTLGELLIEKIKRK